MTPRFILDENVVILAQQGLDKYGNTNPACADLIQKIIEICHTIVVDDVLWDKYIEQLNHPGYHHPNLGPFLIRSLWNALTVSEKVDGLGHTAPIMDDEGSIPSGSQDDAYLVRLAVEKGADPGNDGRTTPGRPCILRNSVQVQLERGFSRRRLGVVVVRSLLPLQRPRHMLLTGDEGREAEKPV